MNKILVTLLSLVAIGTIGKPSDIKLKDFFGEVENNKERGLYIYDEKGSFKDPHIDLTPGFHFYGRDFKDESGDYIVGSPINNSGLMQTVVYKVKKSNDSNSSIPNKTNN